MASGDDEMRVGFHGQNGVSRQFQSVNSSAMGMKEIQMRLSVRAICKKKRITKQGIEKSETEEAPHIE